MVKLIVFIDIDGFLADLHTVWLRRYNDKYNDQLRVRDIKDWNIHQFTLPECGTSMYEFIEDPTIYDDVQPLMGSLSFVNTLYNHPSIRTVYATSATVGTMGRKYKWLKDNGFSKHIEKIECAKNLIFDKIGITNGKDSS